MLRIYELSLEVVRDCMPLVRKVRKSNPPLADQLERALSSIPLNIAEGSGQRGGNRIQRYVTAIASAREVRAAIEVAAVMGYVDADPQLIDKLEKIAATLINAAGR